MTLYIKSDVRTSKDDQKICVIRQKKITRPVVSLTESKVTHCIKFFNLLFIGVDVDKMVIHKK